MEPEIRRALSHLASTTPSDRSERAPQQGRPEIPHGLKAVRDDRAGETIRRPEAGFSLIELLVVLVLLGLMAAVVAPNIASLDAPTATTPSDEVVRLFADVRQGAIEEARPAEIRIDFQSGGYWVLGVAGLGERGRLRAAGQLRVTSGAEVGAWRFTPDGRVMGPALFVMGERPRTIKFDPGTGELTP